MTLLKSSSNIDYKPDVLLTYASCTGMRKSLVYKLVSEIKSGPQPQRSSVMFCDPNFKHISSRNEVCLHSILSKFNLWDHIEYVVLIVIS
ncbi:hypothetical protein P3S68_032414 [Capsicum galapagoense]